mmetsp:Transcript_57009/g.65298  ORF Transcript_57009/g.65298 Transcript_57009/m.65298 type:complete len:145 (-) Transcript_57009:159-593(-)
MDSDANSRDGGASGGEVEEDDNKYDAALDQEYFNDRELLAEIERNMSPSQIERYDEFRKQKLSDAKIKEIVNNVLPGVSVGQGCKTILATSAKVFAGEFIEAAKEVQVEWGDKGALSPRHLREAYRRFLVEDRLHKQTEQKFLF